MKHIIADQYVGNNYLLFKKYFKNEIIPLLKEYKPFIIEIQDKVISVSPKEIIAKYPYGEYGLKLDKGRIAIADYQDYFFDLLFPLEVFSFSQMTAP